MSILCGKALAFFEDELKRLPGNYLEIGIYDGEVIGTLAKQFPDKHFYGVDPFIEDGHTSQHNGIEKGMPMTEQRRNAHRNLDPLANVTLIESTSVAFSDYALKRPVGDGNISAILIDGSHHYPDADNDLRLAMRFLVNGGVIYVDDLETEGVNKACIEFIGREFFRIARWQRECFWINPA